MGGGGAERQLAYLARELVRMGWEVHVALLSGGSNFDRLKTSGAVIHMLRGRNNYDPWIFWQLKRVMRLVNPDLVQTWLLQMDIFGGAAARMARIPWMLSERASELAYLKTIKNRVRLLVGRTASAIISNSICGKVYWKHQLGEAVPQYVVPNALPIEEIEQVRAASMHELGLDAQQRVILFAARFDVQKNLDNLILALRQVMCQVRAVALLCGEGPLRSVVQRKLVDCGLSDQVLLIGYIPRLWDWMKRADVFVSVSTFEGRPNTVLEAMACGCPLVVSDIPSHREFLDEQSALLVNPHVPEAIADAIIGVLSASEVAAHRAETARAKAAQWSIPVIACQYDEIYREVLASCA